MFTGLIESTGTLESRSDSGEAGKLRIVTPIAHELATGDSIAVNGACLTVERIDAGANIIEFHTMSETLSRTNLGVIEPGARVNLERPLRLGDRLGGHLVQGHVDATVPVLKTEQSGDDWIVEIELPERHAASIIEKGSITVDGISLTVAALDPSWFCIHIIPETLERTNIADYASGTLVNLEFDMMGKYILRGEELA